MCDMMATLTHRLIGTDGVDLGPEHDCSEDQKEEALKGEEDEEDDRWWGREVTALWRRMESTERDICHVNEQQLVSSTWK